MYLRCTACTSREVHHHVSRSAHLSVQVFLSSARFSSPGPLSANFPPYGVPSTPYSTSFPASREILLMKPAQPWVVRRSPAFNAASRHLLHAVSCQTFSSKNEWHFPAAMRGKDLHGEGHGCTLQTFCVDESQVFYFKEMQTHFCEAHTITLHVFYHLRLPTESLGSMERSKTGTKHLWPGASRAVTSLMSLTKSSNLFLQNTLVSRTGVSPRTKNALWRVGEDQIYVLVYSGESPQLLKVF